jgi:hypothetical protein
MRPRLHGIRGEPPSQIGRWVARLCDYPTAIIILALGATIACMPLLRYGASTQDPIGIYLDWMGRFTLQLTQGDLYPRWLMGMNQGAGSPVFYYYAPLAYYLTSIPTILLPGLKPTIQLAWADSLLLSLSGLSFYFYARQRFKIAVALPCSLLYILLPYHLEIDTYNRQDIAELANYIWMPLVLCCIDQVFERRRAVCGLAVAYALMLVTHLPTTLLFSVGLCGYIVVSLVVTRRATCLPHLAAGFGLALLLAAVYLVPALFGENYVRMDAMWREDFHIYFFPVRSLEAFGNVEHHDVATRIFTVVSFTTLMFCVQWLTAVRRPAGRSHRVLLGSMVFILASWFLMSSCSIFVWDHAPLLRKTQFPWRLSMVIDLATAITGLYALEALAYHRDAFNIAATTGAVALLIWCLSTAHFDTKIDSFYPVSWLQSRDKAISDGADVVEYMTIWNHTDPDSDTTAGTASPAPISYEASAGQIALISWRPRNIVLDVRLRRMTRAYVHQFYFPNWEAKTERGELLLVKPSEPQGLIEVELPAGSYRLYVTLAPMAQESIGIALSAIGLVVLGLLFFTLERHRTESRSGPRLIQSAV